MSVDKVSLPADSNEKLVSLAENYVRTSGRLIDVLAVTGHAAGNHQAGITYKAELPAQNGRVWNTAFANEQLTDTQASRLGATFASDAQLVLATCVAARKSTSAQGLADRLQVTVHASDENVSAGPDSGWLGPAGSFLNGVLYGSGVSTDPWKVFTPSPKTLAPIK